MVGVVKSGVGEAYGEIYLAPSNRPNTRGSPRARISPYLAFLSRLIQPQTLVVDSHSLPDSPYWMGALIVLIRVEAFKGKESGSGKLVDLGPGNGLTHYFVVSMCTAICLLQ